MGFQPTKSIDAQGYGMNRKPDLCWARELRFSEDRGAGVSVIVLTREFAVLGHSLMTRVTASGQCGFLKVIGDVG
jgi:hypothetical protein